MDCDFSESWSFFYSSQKLSIEGIVRICDNKIRILCICTNRRRTDKKMKTEENRTGIRKLSGIIGMVLSAGMLMSSCGLLPQEEEYRAAPVVREYEAEEYSYAVVSREDVQLTKKISCIYSSAQESQLGFGVSGEKVKSLYAAPGDTVEPGELLAELDMGGLPEEKKKAEQDREEKELKQKHLTELLELEKSRMKTSGETESVTAEGYERQLTELKQDLELLEERIGLLQEQIAARQIVAPAEGSISYVKNDLVGQISREDEILIRIVSGEECYFVAEAAEADVLEEGDSVSVVVGNTTYHTRARIPEEEAEADKIYLVIENGEGQPEVGSKGSATLILDEQKDVLCLVNKAIKKIGTDSVVYYEDENGIKAMKYIETGLVGNQKTEILSGLEFGEKVVVK